jgi:hypothetical protein
MTKKLIWKCSYAYDIIKGGRRGGYDMNVIYNRQKYTIRETTKCKVMEYYFIFALGCKSKLVWGKMCYKGIAKLKVENKACGLIYCFPHSNGMNST